MGVPWSDRSDTAQVELPARPSAAASGRSFAADRLAALPVPDETVDDVLLIVSELVTNAVSHGEPEIVLSIRAEADAVGVSVFDHGTTLPPGHLPVSDPCAAHGRGLVIVDALAEQWGVQVSDEPPGKRVWANIRY